MTNFKRIATITGILILLHLAYISLKAQELLPSVSPGSLNPLSNQFSSPSLIPNDMRHAPGSIFNSGLNNSRFNIIGETTNEKTQFDASKFTNGRNLLNQNHHRPFVEYQPKLVKTAADEVEQFFRKFNNGKGWITYFRIDELRPLLIKRKSLTSRELSTLNKAKERFEFLEVNQQYSRVLLEAPVQKLRNEITLLLNRPAARTVSNE